MTPDFTISSICATSGGGRGVSGSFGSERMPWVSETTTSFSAFIAAATAPAAVSALTFSFPPAWSRAIVAMHGDRVGLHQQLQQPRVDALHFADQAEVDPPAVLAREVGLLGEQHDAARASAGPSPRSPGDWMKLTMNLLIWLHSTCSAIASVRSSV